MGDMQKHGLALDSGEFIPAEELNQERSIMTNPTPHGQVPEALLHASYLESIFVSEEMSSSRACRIAKELRRLHAYCQELETQVIRDCMTHVQKPAETEHVAGDVSKNGVESNMTQQPAPATQQAGVALSDDLRDRLVAISEAIADQDDRAAQAMLREILKAPQADSQPAPVQIGLVATMLDALRHAQKVLNHNNLHLECGPVNAAILAARDPADSVAAPAGGALRAQVETLTRDCGRQASMIADLIADLKIQEEKHNEDRARLFEADLAKLTERGAVAWKGIDPQDLRDGGKP